MATLSLRMRDDMKQKAQQFAKEQGVSLNGFSNATLAQQETLTFFSDRLKDVDQETVHKRVLKLMRKTRPANEFKTASCTM